jgi:hypothetical protein
MENGQTTYLFHSWFDTNETRLVIEERQISEVPVGGLVSGCGGAKKNGGFVQILLPQAD